MNKKIALALLVTLLLSGCSTVNVEKTNELGVQTVKINSQIITLNSTPNITQLPSLGGGSSIEGYNKVDNSFIAKDYTVGFTNAYIGSSIGAGDLAITQSFLDSMLEAESKFENLGIIKLKTLGGGTIEFVVAKYSDRILVARGVDIVFNTDTNVPSETGFASVLVISILPNGEAKQFADLASVEDLLKNITIDIQ